MISSEAHHVVFCCSGQSGLVFLAAAARSVFETHQNPERLRIHIFFEHLEQSHLDRLHASWTPWSESGQVLFYKMSDYLGERALAPHYGYWFRAWVHRVLPEQIERVLYLDTDLVVLRDISPLWNLELRGRLGAMVEDPGASLAKRELIELGELIGRAYEEQGIYFNTGVIFINLCRWREKDVGTILDQSFVDYRPHSFHFDQGEVNLLLAAEFESLSPVWNAILHTEYDLLHTSQCELMDSEMRIRHFAGPDKVTGRWRRLGEKKAFYDVLDRTAWNGWRSPNDRSIAGRLSAQLLEYQYLINNRNCISDFRMRLLKLVILNPALPLLRLLIPLARGGRRILTKAKGR